MPDERDLSGTLLDGRYRLVERLAEGAMGVVYRGVSVTTERAVAVKLMHNSLPGEESARERFAREAKVMALVDHPHCVSVLDYGLHMGKPFLVMELVRGRSLFDVLLDQRRVEIERAADIIRQVLSGLAYAHEQGIIHRDVKPANIMVTPKAPLGVHVRILDFGLARLLEANSSLTTGFAVGTPSYMAPEQCRGDALDSRVDIYACGVTLFEMLTGRKPFVASDPIEIVKLHLTAPAPRLSDVAGGSFGKLEAVVARALAKAPADRYASAIAMSEAIGAAVAGAPVPETTATHLSVRDLEVTSGSTPTTDPSVEVPITVGSSVIEVRRKANGDKPGTSKPSKSSRPAKPDQPDRDEPERDQSDHDASIRRMLPVSRVRWVALLCVVLLGGAIYGVVMLTRTPTTKRDTIATPLVLHDAAIDATAPAPVDPSAAPRAEADALVGAGKIEAAIAVLVKARAQFPDRAAIARDIGKLYFAKLYWDDGIKIFHEAIKLDSSFRSDPDLVKAAIRGFITTPRYDDRLARFVLELGTATREELGSISQSHTNPEVRARASALMQRIK